MSDCDSNSLKIREIASEDNDGTVDENGFEGEIGDQNEDDDERMPSN